jgi:ribosome assembly protein 4
LQGHKNWVLCVAWSPDAKYLVSGSMDGQILVWQADSGKLKGTCRVTSSHNSSKSLNSLG